MSITGKLESRVAVKRSFHLYLTTFCRLTTLQDKLQICISASVEGRRCYKSKCLNIIDKIN